MPDLFEQHSGEILVIGVGAAGGRVSSVGAENSSPEENVLSVCWSAAHVHPAELIATGLEKKIFLDAVEGPFSAQRAAQNVASRETELTRLLSGKSALFLVGSLDEKVTRIFLAPLAEAGRRIQDAFVCAIVSDPATPLSPENEATAEELEAACDLVIRLPARKLANILGDCPLRVLHAEIDKQLLAVVEALAAALCETAPSHVFSVHALRKTLRGSGELRVAMGSADGVDAALLAIDAAAEEIAAVGESIAGTAVSVLTQRELSVAETERAIARLRSLSAAHTLHAFSVQPGLGSEAVCVILARQVGAANIVSIETVRAFNE